MEHIFVVTLLFVGAVSATDPKVSLTCRGEHQYVDTDGNCKSCEKCPTGYQPRGGCGYGSREYGYTCQVCPAGSFSHHNDYKECVDCRPCQEWNSLYVQRCTPSQNSICGSCMSGYYRKSRADGSLDEECRICDSGQKDSIDCKEDDDWPWQHIAIVCASLLGVAIIFIVVIVCFCRIRPKLRNFRSKNVAVFRDTSSPVDLSQNLSDSRSESSIIEMGPVKPVVSLLDDDMMPKAIKPFPQHCRSMDRYSNLPTISFDEDPVSCHNEITPSNVPTKNYDEAHPSQFVQNNGIARSPLLVMSPHQNHSRPSRNRVELTSSHQNLLDHADRDSMLVGHRMPDPTFEPESFDTRSYTTTNSNS